MDPPRKVSGEFQTSLNISSGFQWLLYSFSIIVQVEEVYSFSQDDLLTEDILILDTHAEVFIWVGQSVDSKEKQSAFEIGQVLHNCLGVCHIVPFIMFSVTECYFFIFFCRNT